MILGLTKLEIYNFSTVMNVKDMFTMTGHAWVHSNV